VEIPSACRRRGTMILSQDLNQDLGRGSETGGSYTVKRYESMKLAYLEQLKPLNKEFRTIWISPDQVDELRVIARFIPVMKTSGMQ